MIITRDGGVLLNPAERSRKYAVEIKSKSAITNAGEIKVGKNGKQMKLKKDQLAFRAGYLAARKDIANAYKANKKKGRI